MPILTTLRIGRPVKPSAWPERMPVGKSRHPLARRQNLGHDIEISPGEMDCCDRRKATCSTERSSLALIFSPLNMRVVHSSSLASRASSTSSASVVESIRCFEKSYRIPSKLSERELTRSWIAGKQFSEMHRRERLPVRFNSLPGG
jgi:hypothetical protein